MRALICRRLGVGHAVQGRQVCTDQQTRHTLTGSTFLCGPKHCTFSMSLGFRALKTQRGSRKATEVAALARWPAGTESEPTLSAGVCGLQGHVWESAQKRTALSSRTSKILWPESTRFGQNKFVAIQRIGFERSEKSAGFQPRIWQYSGCFFGQGPFSDSRPGLSG
jgi:hypothetical protein